MIFLSDFEPVVPKLPENKLKLNLGCGRKVFKNNFINADISQLAEADIICDFEQSLPFKNNVFDGIYADNIIEHLSDVIKIMNEIWRVLREDGLLEIIVPHEKSCWANADPTHKNRFNEFSFEYFLKNSRVVDKRLKESYGISTAFSLCKFFYSDSYDGRIHILLQKKNDN